MIFTLYYHYPISFYQWTVGLPVNWSTAITVRTMGCLMLFCFSRRLDIHVSICLEKLRSHQNHVLFSGIICMCDPEGNGLESLMGVFRLPNSDIRVREFSFSVEWCYMEFISLVIMFTHIRIHVFLSCL